MIVKEESRERTNQWSKNKSARLMSESWETKVRGNTIQRKLGQFHFRGEDQSTTSQPY